MLFKEWYYQRHLSCRFIDSAENHRPADFLGPAGDGDYGLGSQGRSPIEYVLIQLADPAAAPDSPLATGNGWD